MKWEWRLEGRVVTADVDLLTARETIRLDGKTLFDQTSWKLRNEIAVPLPSGRDAKLVVAIGTFLLPKCSLIVDGSEVVPTIGAVGGLGSASSVPWWGWVFVGACAVLPVLTLGGAIPAGVGLGCAAANFAIAVSDRPPASKVLIMGAITAAAWFVVIGLGVLLAIATS